jgi:hypothetical protein
MPNPHFVSDLRVDESLSYTQAPKPLSFILGRTAYWDGHVPDI